MIVSGTSNRTSARRLQACVLLCAAAVLPLGVAYAQDYEAVERRLGEAVSKGELTLKQAAAMMDALRKTAAKPTKKGKPDADLEAAWQKLLAMVKAGKLTEEQAHAKMAALKKANRPVKKTAKPTKKGKRDEALVGHYRKMGVSGETLGRIKEALADSGVSPKQMEGTLGGMLRVIHEMRSEGERFELDPRLRHYLAKEVGLTGKQIERVLGLARRIAGGPEDPDRRRGSKARPITREDYARAEAELKKAVAAGKLSPEHARARLQGLRKMLAGQTGEDERAAKYRAIEAEIRAAVNAGKISPEAAERKLAAARKKMWPKK